MIDQFVAQNPNVIIVLQTMNCLPPDTSPFSPRVDLNGYYQIYRDVAVERGAILVDHYPNWLDVYNNNFALWQTYMRDAVHPSALGEANVLTPELQRILEADPDETAPTLTSIVDDKSGGPVSTHTLVTYTVTFSENMNWTSVDTGDFSNAGSSAIDFGSVSEVSPGVFTVEVCADNARRPAIADQCRSGPERHGGQRPRHHRGDPRRHDTPREFNQCRAGLVEQSRERGGCHRGRRLCLDTGE